MRSYGKVYSAFWSDRRTAMLSDRGKVLALYLLTGPHSNGIGCYRLPFGYVSEDLRWPLETVSETVSELLSNGFINRCETTGWVFIPRFLRHNAPENPNVCKSLIPLIMAVPKDLPFYQGLIDAVEEVVEARPKGFPERFLEPFRKGMANKEPKPSLSQAIAKPQPEPAVSDEPPEPAAADPANAVIALFDDCRAEIFGENQRRPWPGPKDRAAALEIIEVSADPAAMRAAFLAVFQRQKASGQRPAGSLRYMLQPVREAVAKPPVTNGTGAANGHGWEPKPEQPPALRAQIRAIERKDRETAKRMHDLLASNDPSADAEAGQYLAQHGEPEAA